MALRLSHAIKTDAGVVGTLDEGVSRQESIEEFGFKGERQKRQPRHEK
jgi:hypothetical protein